MPNPVPTGNPNHRELLEPGLTASASDVVLQATVAFRMVPAHGARRPAYTVRVAPAGCA